MSWTSASIACSAFFEFYVVGLEEGDEVSILVDLIEFFIDPVYSFMKEGVGSRIIIKIFP